MDIDDEAHPKIRKASSKWKYGFRNLCNAGNQRSVEETLPEDFLVAERPATEQGCEIRRKGIC